MRRQYAFEVRASIAFMSFTHGTRAINAPVPRCDERAISPVMRARFAALFGVALLGCDDASSLGPEDAATDGADAMMPCAGSGVTKGPWVLAVDDTHATVRWETCRSGTPGDVTFTPEQGGAPIVATATETETDLTVLHQAYFNSDASPDYPGAWFMHEAVLSALAPATCYGYTLAADSTRTGRFCTARASGAPLKFLAIGDTMVGLQSVTANILSHAMAMGPELTLHLGDILYLTSGFDTWEYWDAVMRPALAHGAFYPAIGNHESATPDEFDGYVMRFFHGAGFGGTDQYYGFETAGVYFFMLDTELPMDSTSPQAAWFAQQIAAASQRPGYRFSVVGFHKPFVTCGDTGDDPAARAYFEPLFVQYKVPLVLQAHMHGYERFDFGDITYVTTAGGGGTIGDPNLNLQRSYCGQRVASGGFFHATVIEVGSTTLTGTAIDDSGAVQDTFQITLP